MKGDKKDSKQLVSIQEESKEKEEQSESENGEEREDDSSSSDEFNIPKKIENDFDDIENGD